MKKTLLTFLLAGATLSLAAQNDATYSGSMLYGHCTTPSTALVFPETLTAGEAMQLPASVIRQLQGCKITAVAIANGVSYDNYSTTSLPITVFMTDSLGGTPATEFTATLPLTPDHTYTEFTLPEPIAINASLKPFYVGFYGVCDPAIGTPLIVDGRSNSTAGEGDWFGTLDTASGTWDWQQLQNYYGFGCLRLKIEGATLPANQVIVEDSHVPDFVAPGATGRVEMFLRNDAGNEVSTVDVTYTIGGGDPQTAKIELDEPLLYNEYTVNPVGFNFTAPTTPSANCELKFSISGVNGTAANTVNPANATGSGYFVSISEGFKKNMVAEIATGTWCGFCPMGFVSVHQMLADHPDGTFIPIAVHSGDEMAELSYYALGTDFTGEGSAPKMVVNRNVNTYGVQNPMLEIMRGIYPAVTSTPAVAKVGIGQIEFDAAKKLMNITSQTEFAVDEADANYAVAYVITEDNVGPYSQHNYFAPGEQANSTEMGEWNTLPADVDTTFNAVARIIRKFNGVTGSIPSLIEVGKIYSHTAELQTNAVDNIENTHIIAMVINRTTGRIENAVSVDYSANSAIHAVESASETRSTSIYDLQGRRVMSPAGHGIYIINGKKIIK